MSDPRAFNLTDLMADLADDGVRESSGAFTLDPKEAERKLQSFTLARPQDYILKLVQAAVAAGASKIEVESRAGEVEVSWDGPPLRSEWLPGLMGHLLSAHSPAETRHLRQLAAGLRGSVAVGPRSLSVESGTGAEAFRRRWSGEGWVETSLPDRKATVTRVHLARDLGRIFSEWGAEIKGFVLGHGNFNEEEAALAQHCRYLPVPLVVNGLRAYTEEFGRARYPGYKIEEDEFPGESRAPKFVLANDSASYVEGKLDRRHHLIECQILDPSGTLPPLGPRTATLRVGETPPAGARCRAWIALEAALQSSGRVKFIDDGVLIASEEIDSDVPGLVAVVSVEGLAKDLTGFQLIKDQGYTDLLAWLGKQGRELRCQLLDRLDDIPIRRTVSARLGSAPARPVQE